MELKEILDAIESSCDGKGGSDEVQVPAQLLLAAQKELKDKAQMARDLEMARDEASMKPSVARKLNEKIRGLETELEQLRSNKKVKELEKKVQFLEHELKQSYTTKNFTLKSGLLELEKQYRAHMNVDPAMAAFWDDITVLLDEKKERDTPFIPRGPRATTPAAGEGTGLRTPRLSTGSLGATPTGPAAGGEQAPAAGSDVTPASAAPLSADSTARPGPLERSVSSGVQSQVDTFNTIISEEAASAASLPADLHTGKQESGEMVVRHGAGFRVVRPAGTPDPHADVIAATSSSGPDATAVQSAEQQQAVQLLRQDIASRVKDVSFHAMPANKQTTTTSAAGEPQAAAMQLLDQQSQAVTGSIQSLLELFSSLAGDTTALPQPPLLASSSEGQQQEQQQLGEVDTSSLWQQRLQQLLESAQQLQQQQQAGPLSEQGLQQQQATAAELLDSVSRMHAVLDGDEAGAAAAKELAALRQELLLLQQSQQVAAAEAGGQQLLVAVFGEFLQQLEQQGVLAPGADAAAAAASADGQQQPALLALLQSFLQANPQVPQMLAVQLAPAVPASHQQQQQPVQAEVSTSAVQAVADAEHREVQCEAAEGQHVSTQSDPLPGPSDHAETQTEPPPRPSDHAETQTEPPVPSVSHVSTQAAAESVSAGMQTTPPSAVAAAVQAELKPEGSEAGLQVDLPAVAAAEPAEEQPAAADAAEIAPTAAAAAAAGSTAAPLPKSPTLQDSERHGSGIIYGASGSELSVSKAAVGQQLDILHRIERSRAGTAAGAESVPGAAAVMEVKPDELQDLGAVAKELGQLRADNLELAASLQVTQSLVDHLNTNLKAAIDKADDAEAEAVQIKQQLETTAASLGQLQSEHAEVTHVLIEAKVEIAEKKGELLKLVRDLRRAISNPVQNAAGVVKELENILAVVPSADDDVDVPANPATASRQGSSFDLGRQGGLGAGLAAGFGHMREALGGFSAALPAGLARTGRVSDSSAAVPGPVKAEGAAAETAEAAKPDDDAAPKP